MNSNRLGKTLSTLGVLALFAAGQALAAGAVGEKAPNFSLKGVDGKTYSLDELTDHGSLPYSYDQLFKE